MHNNNILLSYIPHGSNPNQFYPINETSDDWIEYCKFKSDFDMKSGNPEFIILFNSRNIRRKSPGDIILSYKRFCDGLPKEKSAKCCLIMKTAIIDENGTDLLAVKRAICPKYQIVFIPDALTNQQMNWLYNISDVVLFLSSAEGFGLAANEGLMVGKLLIAPVIGGLQDQMRFEDENGNWINNNFDYISNDRAKYKNNGKWVFPLFPTARALNGSIATPYIMDYYVDSEHAAHVIRQIYNMDKNERIERGQAGRQWVLSTESGMSAPVMCDKFIKSVDMLLNTWQPPESKWEMLEIAERPVMDDMGIQWWEN